MKTRAPKAHSLVVGFVTWMAAATWTSVASAEPSVPMSTDARASQLFLSGEKKFDGGDYAGACADFSESLKLGPKLGTLLNLALCHETVGKLVTAWSEFTHGAAWASQNNQRDRLDFATTHVRSLEPRLPRIVLQLPTDRALESLDLDGEPVPEQQWYLPLYLDPGEHRLAATAPGKRRTTVAFRVMNSPTDQLVMVPNLQDDTGKAEATGPKGDPLRRPLGIGGLALGAVGLGLGTTFGVLAATRDTPTAANSDATIATLSFLGGAVFTFVGGWLIWNSPARTAGVAVTPTGVDGRF
jgi:hypothetical protein